MSSSTSHSPRNRWLALAALSIGSLIGVLVAVFGHHSAAPVATEQRPAQAESETTPPVTSMLSATSPQVPVLKPEMILSSQNDVPTSALITGRGKPAPSLWQPSATASASQASSSNNNNNRGRTHVSSSPTRSAPSTRDLPEPPSPRALPEPAPTRAAQRAPEPAIAHRGVEEGADLPFVRRSLNVRIDRENPYQ